MTVGCSGRILVVDDNPAIHDDIRKILAPARVPALLDDLEADLFGDSDAPPEHAPFHVHSAFQGRDGYEAVRAARMAGEPFAMAFVDMRMPPGWDGAETIARMWDADPAVQIVLCTAYSDYSWETLSRRFGARDGLLILKKPFDNVEILQAAHALTHKWTLARRVSEAVAGMESAVTTRTRELSDAMDKLAREVRERDRLETELRLATKLQAVGQLAAGIAHEINTPMQYLGDAAHFLRDSFGDLLRVAAPFREMVGCLAGSPVAQQAQDVYDAADIDYLEEHVPRSFDRMLEGIERVSTIVRAMKELGHPEQREHAPADLNRAITTALVVSRNEHKYVADVETSFGTLPLVMCNIGELSQVFLNLLVNAAHAIGDTVAGTDRRGTIRVRTSHRDDVAVIEIEDTGCGIPEAARDRIFEPFFTTKPVGKGTGQGLPIARSIVVDRHGGRLTFRTELGRGTTFVVELPIEGMPR